MKRLFLFVSVAMLAGAACAAEEWSGLALAEIQRANPQAALKILKPYSTLKQGQILLCAAYAQQYDQAQDMRAMSKATQEYKDLLPRVAMDDAVLLHALRRLKGSLLHSYTETLLDQALRRVDTPDHARAVPGVLASIYQGERRKVFAALSDWLSLQRAALLSGKELDEQTREVFTDPKLITALLDSMELKKKRASAVPSAFASPKPAAMKPAAPMAGVPARMQPPRTNATARECLVLIEEPAIPKVREMLPELGDEGVALLSEICAAKSLRESKAPDFMWSAPCGQ